jgi:hypothetical protein
MKPSPLLAVAVALVLSCMGCGDADILLTCDDGSFATDGSGDCIPWTVCAVGSVATTPPTATTDRVCGACLGGTYCAGGDAMPVACAALTWDHDADPATVCVAVSDCEPGTFVSSAPTATEDRGCAACGVDSYSETVNAASCTPATVCEASELEAVAPTPTSDRRCDLAEWTVLMGTTGTDDGYVLALDGDGGVHVGANVTAAFPGWTLAGNTDVAVLHFDGDGAGGAVDQLGSTLYDVVSGLARGADGRVHVLLTAQGLIGASQLGSFDFVSRHYAPDGTVERTVQFGTNTQDVSGSLAVDTAGNVYVAGQVRAALGDQTALGDADGVLQKYDPTGALLWTRQFGTAGYDQATWVAITSDGHVVVSGYVTGTLPGETGTGGIDSFAMAFDADGALLWQDQHGTTATEFGVSIATDAAGNAYFLGRTQGTYPMATSAGSNDVIVRAYDADGAVLYTTQFGTSGIDDSMSISAAPDGRVFAVGVTQGTFSGEISAGGADAFLAELDVDGALVGVRQFGSAGTDVARDVAFDPRGKIYLVGNAGAEFAGQTPSGPSDIFVMSLLPSP